MNVAFNAKGALPSPAEAKLSATALGRRYLNGMVKNGTEEQRRAVRATVLESQRIIEASRRNIRQGPHQGPLPNFSETPWNVGLASQQVGFHPPPLLPSPSPPSRGPQSCRLLDMTRIVLMGCAVLLLQKRSKSDN